MYDISLHVQELNGAQHMNQAFLDGFLRKPIGVPGPTQLRQRHLRRLVYQYPVETAPVVRRYNAEMPVDHPDVFHFGLARALHGFAQMVVRRDLCFAARRAAREYL